MTLRLTDRWQQRANQEREWLRQFGSTDTLIEAQQARARYQAWLATPEATWEILQDPWKANLEFTDTARDGSSVLRRWLDRVKTGKL